MMDETKKKNRKKAERFVPHHPWELEVQTEGLDEIQGERLEKEPKKRKDAFKD